ncbi:hypothetical protein ABIC63_005987 [Pseudacidovorax sp. 1753]|uniref:hypothetical protein n=1 Tax=Pseudacidovorax sp. 1753 TaxID=3156419 RepID=UPI003399CFFF
MSYKVALEAQASAAVAQASTTANGAGGGRGSVNFNEAEYNAYITAGETQRLAARSATAQEAAQVTAQQERQGMMIAAALSGGASVLDASLPAGVASGMGNPITAAIAKPLADAIVDYDLGPRVQGLTGTVMASFGVAAGAASGNVLLTGLSLDQMYAQASMAVFGTPAATVLNRGLQEGLGLSPAGAAMGEMALTMGAAAGPAVMSALRSRAVPSWTGEQLALRIVEC